MFCGMCGASQDAGETFCGMCGAPLDGPADHDSDQFRTGAAAFGTFQEIDVTTGLPARRGSRRSLTPWLLVVAGVVVLGALATAGWRLRWPHSVFASGQSSTTAPPATGTVAPAGQFGSGATGTAPTSTTTTTEVVTTTPLPVHRKPPPPALVKYASGTVRSNPFANDVASTFTTYFGGIDDHNFQRAYFAYSPSYRSTVSLAAFASGDKTSRILHGVIRSIEANSDGSLTTDVTFTSHQAPAYGPVPGERCTNWSIAYHLVPSSGGNLAYLIQSATGIGAGDRPC
jgi:hypothetical protein